MDEYARPNITEDQLYLIDKVVRLRAKEGRFGVDHSEILNYELELANSARDDHMNSLVYKTKNPYSEIDLKYAMPPSAAGKETSNVLFKRLSNKGHISRSSRCSLLESDNKS